MEVLDIDHKIPAILSLTIVTTMVFLMIKLLKCLQVIKDLVIGFLRPDTLSPAIAEQQLMMMGLVCIGLRQTTLPPITQVTMVDC